MRSFALAQCDFCGKSKMFGHAIQHRHSTKWALRAPKTSREFKPNIQHTKVTASQIASYLKRSETFSPELRKAGKLPAETLVRTHVCTRCLRTMNKA
jgi:ribosomal protein L28